MSYRDPYYNQGYEYNPYSSSQQQQHHYPSYGQHTTNDDYLASSNDKEQSFSRTRGKENDEASGFDREEFNPTYANLKEYRRSYRGNLWTKGGKGRCCGRFFCCTILIGVFLLISIVLTLVLYIVPPSVVIGKVTVGTSSTGSAFSGTGINLPLNVPISVNNPNYFSVMLKQLKAEFTYPQGNVPVGNGTLNDIVFQSRTKKDFTFPFAIDYEFSDDPQFNALIDIAQKCGITGNSKSNLIVKFKITVKLRILVADVSPAISDQISFPCPFSESDIQGIRNKIGPFLGAAGRRSIDGVPVEVN